MKTILKKFALAALALCLFTGAVSYPTHEANAGVGIAVVGALATNGTGAVLLPEGLAIAGMLGGVAMFGVTCFTLLEGIEPGSYGRAFAAFGLLFLDKGVENKNLQADLRQKLITSYKNYNLDENDADLLAQIIVNKISNTQIIDNSSQEILFSNNEISQVVNSIAETNPALAMKITTDFTQSSVKNQN